MVSYASCLILLDVACFSQCRRSSQLHNYTYVLLIGTSYSLRAFKNPDDGPHLALHFPNRRFLLKAQYQAARCKCVPTSEQTKILYARLVSHANRALTLRFKRAELGARTEFKPELLVAAVKIANGPLCLKKLEIYSLVSLKTIRTVGNFSSPRFMAQQWTEPSHLIESGSP